MNLKMKTPLTLLIIAIYLFTFSKIYSQESTFFSNNCSNVQHITNAPCFSYNEQLIQVTGQGIMGEDNYGLVEAYFDVDQLSSYQSQMIIVSPGGVTHTLSSFNFGSFPGYGGTNGGEILDVGFRQCPDLPASTDFIDNVSQLLFDASISSTFNDGVSSADGTWKLRTCHNDAYVDIWCARLKFGQLCPEVESVNITNATCASSSDGSIDITSSLGSCGDVQYSIDGVNFQLSNVFTGLAPGEYTITTVDGFYGASPNCLLTHDITINSDDNEAPTLTNCPIDQTISMDENCQGTWNMTDPTIADNCEIDFTSSTLTLVNGTTQTFAISSGGTFGYFDYDGPGDIVIDWLVIDGSGNEVSCQNTITLEDTSPPTLTNCPIDQTINMDENCQGSWTMTDPTISDNCGIATMTSTLNLVDGTTQVFDIISGGTFGYNNYDGPGEIVIDWLVIDESGLEVSCQNTITMKDVTLPVLSNCPVNQTIFLDDNCQGTWTMTHPTYSDNCGIVLTEASLYSQQTGTVEFIDFIPGSTITYSGYDGPDVIEVNWLVEDAGDPGSNQTTCQNTITLVDNAPPSWINNDIMVTGECGLDDLQSLLNAAESMLEATDNCDSDIEIIALNNDPIISSICGNSESYQYDYEAMDDAGNISGVISIVIEMIDSEAPILIGIPPNVTINCDDEFPEIPQPTATDLCQGDISADITMDNTTIEGTCNFNETAEINTYSWTIFDACGNENSLTWTVTVINDVQISLGDDITACSGEPVFLASTGLTGTYLWSNGATTDILEVTENGVYSVTVTSVNGCCSFDEVLVLFEAFPDAQATGGVLDCSGSDIQLMGSSTSNNVNYSWTGPGGYTSNEQNPFVSQVGTYALNVSSPAGCTTTAEAIVEADNGVPDITTSGGTIDCETSEVMLIGNSSVPDVTYSWIGPNGFSSDEPNPTVSVSGDYALTITAPNNCIAEGLAVVIDDTMEPIVTTIDATINCENPAITLSTNSSDPDATFLWTGPNGYSSTEQSPEVDMAGTYSLVVTGTNSCTSAASSTVEEDTMIPNLVSDGGTLDCDNDSINLSAESTTSDVIFQWSGPNGFSSTEANPLVDVIGEYMITVTSLNGCINSSTVEVDLDNSPPVVNILGVIIDCGNPMPMINLTSDGNDSYSWEGPNGYSSSEEDPAVSEGGLYSVTVTGENGCTSSESIDIEEDLESPAIMAENGTLNCMNTSLNLSLTADGNYDYLWSGPGGFTSTEQNPNIDEIGMYIVAATGENGCEILDTVQIDEDFEIPNASATGGEISCDANNVEIMGSSTTADVTYSWTGPNGFTSELQNPTVGSPGIYNLEVTAPNGCIGNSSAEVLADENLPNISAEGGIIDCNTSEVQVMGSSSTENVELSWTGPNGFTSMEENPIVDVPGIYTLTVLADNGCSTETDVTVEADLEGPILVALGGEIDCLDSEVQIAANSTEGATFTWTGPDGFLSDLANPVVNLPGEYIATATGLNGCISTQTVEVTLNADFPEVTIDTNPDCDDHQLTLILNTNELGLSITWTKDGQIFSDGTIVTISQQGVYIVQIVAPNGCSISESYVIEDDLMDLEAAITTVDATDGDNGGASIEITNSNISVDILWDNGETGSTASALSVGDHTVTVTDAIGCEFEFSFEIKMSTGLSDIIELIEWKVYPTLTQDLIRIDASFNKNINVELIIIDNLERQILSRSYTSISAIRDEINTDGYAVGTYSIYLRTKNGVRSQRFIKIH